MRPLPLLGVIDAAGKGAGGQRVALAVIARRAGIEWQAARRVGEIALDSRIGGAEEQAADIGQPQRGGEIERGLELEPILHLMLERGRADDPDRAAGAIDVVIATRRRRAGRAFRGGGAGKADRLTATVDMIDASKERERPEPIAERAAELIGRQGAVRAVQVDLLHRGSRDQRALQTIGQARRDVDNGADRVARICRRERPVEHVDAGNLLGRYQAPARAGRGVVVADQRREDRAVGVDQAARASAEPRGACRKRRLAVADMAFANDEARQIFERILDIARVDRRRDRRGVDRRLGRRRVLDRRGAALRGDENIVEA